MVWGLIVASAVLALGAWLSRRRYEALSGLLGVVTPTVSLVVAAVVLINDYRPLNSLAYLAVTFSATLWTLSSQWRRRWLRVVGALALLSVALVLVQAGRAAVATSEVVAAYDRLQTIDTVAKSLKSATEVRKGELASTLTSANVSLTKAISEYGSARAIMADAAIAVSARVDAPATKEQVAEAHRAFIRVSPALPNPAEKKLIAAENDAEDVPSLVELRRRSGVESTRRRRQFRRSGLSGLVCRDGCGGAGLRRAGASACSP